MKVNSICALSPFTMIITALAACVFGITLSSCRTLTGDHGGKLFTTTISDASNLPSGYAYFFRSNRQPCVGAVLNERTALISSRCLQDRVRGGGIRFHNANGSDVIAHDHFVINENIAMPDPAWRRQASSALALVSFSSDIPNSSSPAAISDGAATALSQEFFLIAFQWRDQQLRMLQRRVIVEDAFHWSQGDSVFFVRDENESIPWANLGAVMIDASSGRLMGVVAAQQRLHLTRERQFLFAERSATSLTLPEARIDTNHPNMASYLVISSAASHNARNFYRQSVLTPRRGVRNFAGSGVSSSSVTKIEPGYYCPESNNHCIMQMVPNYVKVDGRSDIPEQLDHIWFRGEVSQACRRYTVKFDNCHGGRCENVQSCQHITKSLTGFSLISQNTATHFSRCPAPKADTSENFVPDVGQNLPDCSFKQIDKPGRTICAADGSKWFLLDQRMPYSAGAGEQSVSDLCQQFGYNVPEHREFAEFRNSSTGAHHLGSSSWWTATRDHSSSFLPAQRLYPNGSGHTAGRLDNLPRAGAACICRIPPVNPSVQTFE